MTSQQISNKKLSCSISSQQVHYFPPCRSPLNEDVFTPPGGNEVRSVSPDVAQLSEKIHRVLVQPVHCGSSQGYGSLGSGTEQHASTGSSSDSAGRGNELRSLSQNQLRPVSEHANTDKN